MDQIQRKERKDVFTIVVRNERSYWVKLGMGFVNKDGSLNLYLDALPTNGTLQVRDWEPKAERRSDEGVLSVVPASAKVEVGQ